ncbi:MAG: tRNA (adenosine(37)-N6)-dimethylallyltransferase MiaA [Deltaproteobacteria bacterium]|nr:MAG: tRNA (adenosine(37)-N6)-dimethylallyltransferase MiaA [Deltaproteobacteria bacterium]
MGKPKVIVVTGPTASGKSGLALELARQLEGELVSADSMQIYRGFDIGTAKPDAEELAEVPHHLVDVADPKSSYSAGEFRRDALSAILDISRRGKLPIVVGGTGLYIKVLLEGLVKGAPKDEELRKALSERWDAGGAEELLAELEKVDPLLAKRLHSNDKKRVLRGLEVWRLTGVPLSKVQEEHAFAEREVDAKVYIMEVERAELYERINRRVDAMISAGWVDEVRSLLSSGLSPEIEPMRAIGYKELSSFIAGEGSLEGAISAIKQSTRRFAKRQITWYRRMEGTRIQLGETERVISETINFLQNK